MRNDKETEGNAAFPWVLATWHLAADTLYSPYEKCCIAVTAILKLQGNSPITHSCIHTHAPAICSSQGFIQRRTAPVCISTFIQKDILTLRDQVEPNIAVSHLLRSQSHTAAFPSVAIVARSNSRWPPSPLRTLLAARLLIVTNEREYRMCYSCSRLKTL